MKPWQQPNSLRDRLRELLWQSISAPYLVAYALTVLFLVRQDAIARDAMLAAWALAWARREIAARRSGGLPNGLAVAGPSDQPIPPWSNNYSTSGGTSDNWGARDAR